MTQLHELDAHGQADLLAAREVSSVELVEHHLARVESLDPGLGAFITVTADRALAGAAEADRLRAAGPAPRFLGVPTALKDLNLTAGVPTSMGSRARFDLPGDVDDAVVRLIAEAGFISLGKTNTPEVGLSSFTDNDVRGPASTPWDLSRNAGGSSGGAAAAVAAGLVPVALGSDGGGSLRIPASCCGIHGFKPTRGRVGPGPLGSDWSGLASNGPLARSVRDLAALLDVLCVPQVGDARWVPAPVEPFTAELGRDPGSLRIAAWSQSYLGDIATDPRIVDQWESICRLMDRLGHRVEIVDPPFPAELEPRFNVIWSAGVAAALIDPGQEASLRDLTRYWRERGGRTSAAELVRAVQFVEGTCRAGLAALADFDVFLTPTLAMLPQPHAYFRDPDPAVVHRRELEFTPFTALWNMCGIPAASAPLGQVDGLPVGMMFAAHAGSDALLVRLLDHIQQS